VKKQRPISGLLLAASFWLLPAFIATSAAQSAGVDLAECLSFNQALDLAAKNDPGIRIAQAELSSVETDLTEAKALRRPQVSAFSRYGVGDEGLVNSAIENQFGLRASQRLIDFGDSRLAREAAQEAIYAQENLVLSAEQDVVLRAGLSYIDWLEARAQLEATVERADYFARELSTLKRALESGGATMAEVAEISAEKAQSESDRFELEYELSRAQIALRIATRSDQALCTSQLPIIEASLNPLAEGAQAQNYTANAVASNPGVKALQRTAQKLDLEAEREKRSRLPIIEAVGIASYTSDDIFGSYQFRDRLGVDVSVPLYTGSMLKARQNRALAEARKARGDLDQRKQDLEMQTVTTYRRVLLLRAQSGRRDAVTEFRQTEFDAVQNGYENGIGTLPELVDSRLQLENAKLRQIGTQFLYLREALTLKSLTGSLK